MTPEQVAEPGRASRYRVAVGTVCGALGLGALALLISSLFKLAVADEFKLTRGDFGLLLGLGFVGYLMCGVGWRLVTRRGRTFGDGLLSPAVLNVGGVLFMLSGVIQAVENRGDMRGSLASIVAGSTCFGLARYRERREKSVANRDHVA